MSSFRSFSTYALAYLLWGISVILSGMVLIQGRDAVFSVLVVSTYDRFKDNASALFYASLQTRTMDQWSYLLLGLLLIVLIVFYEHYFRTGVQPGSLRQRFFQVTSLEFGALCLANLINAIVIWDVSGFTWQSLFYPLLELITTVVFVWLWIETRRARIAALANQPV